MIVYDTRGYGYLESLLDYENIKDSYQRKGVLFLKNDKIVYDEKFDYVIPDSDEQYPVEITTFSYEAKKFLPYLEFDRDSAVFEYVFDKKWDIDLCMLYSIE